MKVLLDTNIWISGLLWGENPKEDLLVLGEFQQIPILRASGFWERYGAELSS